MLEDISMVVEYVHIYIPIARDMARIPPTRHPSLNTTQPPAASMRALSSCLSGYTFRSFTSISKYEIS
jgi:hypothetical protein